MSKQADRASAFVLPIILALQGRGVVTEEFIIKPQYNNAINTQHCGRLPEKTNVHQAGHLNKLKRAQRDAKPARWL